MTRVVALVPDLLFGSQVSGALSAAGYEVALAGSADQAREAAAGAAVLVVDLTADHEQRLAAFAELRAAGALEGLHTLAFYSHVEADVRAAADAAGFDRVVPRSRMAREGAVLVAGLLADG